MNKRNYSLTFLFFFLSSQLIHAAATERTEIEMVIQGNNISVKTEEEWKTLLGKHYLNAALAQNPQALAAHVNYEFYNFLESIKTLETLSYQEIALILAADSEVHRILVKNKDFKSNRVTYDFMGCLAGSGGGMIAGTFLFLLPVSYCMSPMSMAIFGKVWVDMIAGGASLGACAGTGTAEYLGYSANSSYEEVQQNFPISLRAGLEEDLNILKKDKVFAISFSRFDASCNCSELSKLSKTAGQMNVQTYGATYSADN